MKRVHYSKREETYLRYATGHAALYADDAAMFLLPGNDHVLLRHMASLAEFVEQLLRRQIARRERDEPVTNSSVHFLLMDVEEEAQSADEHDAVDTGQAQSFVWRWHSDLAARTCEMTGLFANAFLLSWSALCQLFYLAYYESPERYSRVRQWRAQDYPFYRRVAAKHNIEISGDPLSLYRVTDVWDSVRLIVTEALYTEPYDAEMKQYFYALFFRYCELMTVREPELEAMLDNPRFVEFLDGGGDDDEAAATAAAELEEDEEGDETAYDSYKRVKIPVSETCALRSDYFYEGEVLFYNQLYRLILSDRLLVQYETTPIVLVVAPTTETRQLCQAAWLDLMSYVCQHKELGQFIVADFKAQMMQLYLFHGEVERFRRQWPESNSEPGDVLLMFRAADHMEALRIQSTPPLELIRAHNADTAVYERECAFLTRQVTKHWLGYQGVRRARNLERYFVIESMLTMAQLEALLLRDDKTPPLLLCLMRIYYVVDGEHLYRTPHFIQAYMLWLSQMILRDIIRLSHLPQALQACIGHFRVI